MARPVCSECRYMHEEQTPNFRTRMFCGLAEGAEIKMYRKKRPDWCPLLSENIKTAGKKYKYELNRSENEDERS